MLIWRSPRVQPDAKRVINFKDIPDVQMKSIKAPALIIIADRDVIKPEHALEMQRQIAGPLLAVCPCVHGEYIGEIITLKSNSNQVRFVIPIIEPFLDNASSGLQQQGDSSSY